MSVNRQNTVADKLALATGRRMLDRMGGSNAEAAEMPARSPRMTDCQGTDHKTQERRTTRMRGPWPSCDGCLPRACAQRHVQPQTGRTRQFGNEIPVSPQGPNRRESGLDPTGRQGCLTSRRTIYETNPPKQHVCLGGTRGRRTWTSTPAQ